MDAHLDRALADQTFLNCWDNVELLILPMLCSDHHTIRLTVAKNEPNMPLPFRFQDMWTLHEGFFILVRECQRIPTPPLSPAERIIYQLKRLKAKFKTWNKDTFWNVHTEIQWALDTLGQIQN